MLIKLLSLEYIIGYSAHWVQVWPLDYTAKKWRWIMEPITWNEGSCKYIDVLRDLFSRQLEWEVVLKVETGMVIKFLDNFFQHPH